MDALLEGYRRFRAETWPEERARYQALARWGQRPETLVISCSDSRVDPQTVFGAVPGELFVVRNVAALVPPYAPDANYHGTSAALEFGVRVLGVQKIVVLGHALCGGVMALMDGAPAEARDFVEPWMGMAAGVRDPEADALEPEARRDRYEAAVVRLSLANLMTFPWIAEAVEAGRLALHGFRFDIHTGILARVGEGGFEPVT
jgi:carbonic anhydrase